MGLPELLSETAGRLPDKKAIVFGGVEVTYADLEDCARRVAGALIERGVKKSDRVVLLGPNRPEWLAALYGVVGAGAVLVPVNPALASGEIEYIVSDCEPKVLLVDRSQREKLRDLPDAAILELSDFAFDRGGRAGTDIGTWVDRAGEDPAIIFYTSGTTGRPKGAVLSNAATRSTSVRCGEAWGMTECDRHLVAGSLAFIYNSVINAGSAFAVGGTIVLQERMHPGEALEAIVRNRITVLMTVPTAYVMMAEWAQSHPVDASSVRIAVCAGAYLAPNVVTRVRERLGIELFDGWGMTEGTPITGYEFGRFTRGKPDSAGRPLPGCEVRIVDDNERDLPIGEVGELLFKSPSNMTEYFKRPKDTAEALRGGWMHSGDLARSDEEGFVYIVGRRKEMIIRGGANIYPAEIEEVLFGHEGIAECAVVGVPDDRFGEIVKAFVVPAGDRVLDPDDIRAFCRERLAEYKVPQLIEFIESLPKGPTGKILKRLLMNPGNRT